MDLFTLLGLAAIALLVVTLGLSVRMTRREERMRKWAATAEELDDAEKRRHVALLEVGTKGAWMRRGE